MCSFRPSSGPETESPGTGQRSSKALLAAAIERCGNILATEFPIGEDDVNELKDTLIIRE